MGDAHVFVEGWLLRALVLRAADGNGGMDGEDDMVHVGRAPSQEAAVTSRRQQAHIPMSRSRLFTGSVGDDRRSYGDDPSLQNAVEAFHNFQVWSLSWCGNALTVALFKL